MNSLRGEFARCESMSATWSSIRDKELDDLVRLGFDGASASLALSAEFAADPDNLVWDYFDEFVDGCLARDIRFIIILSEGPPVNAAWKALNAGVTWTVRNRPPAGTANAIYDKLVLIFQAVIDRAKDKVEADGKVWVDTAVIRLGNEPAKGGSGGPWVTSGPFTYDAPYSGYADGTWDDQYHTYLSYVATRLEFYDCHVLAPSFECSSAFATELTTVTASAGSGWRSVITAWSKSAYINRPTHWANGPDEFAQAWHDSQVTQIDQIRGIQSAQLPIMISEYGCSPAHIGMDGTWKRKLHYGEHGLYMRALRGRAKQLSIIGTTFYALTEPTTVDPTTGSFAPTFYNGSGRSYRASWRHIAASGRENSGVQDPEGNDYAVAPGEVVL